MQHFWNQDVALCCRYNYKHCAIVGAVGESAEGGMSFSFWEDKVRRQPCRSTQHSQSTLLACASCPTLHAHFHSFGVLTVF